MSEASGQQSRRSKIKGFFKGSSKPSAKESSENLSVPQRPHVPKVDGSIKNGSLVTAETKIENSIKSISTNTSSPTSEPDSSARQAHPEASVSVASSTDRDVALIAARNQLWKRAFERLREEQPELVELYEKILMADADTETAETLTPEATTAIVVKQQNRMKSKQWTYSWFGKPQKVRDTAESILTAIEKVSGIVSVGISAAPPFVSLPWSMATSLIAFVMNDFEAVNSAIEGLKEVTLVLANYSLAEREFLLDPITRKDYEDTVIGLYTAIFEYQARAAQYFTRNTLKRFRTNTVTAKSWPDAVDNVRNIEKSCQVPMNALGVRLSQGRFKNVDDVLNQGLKLMEQISRSVTSDRAQRERVLQWTSPINYLQDHVDLRNQIGDTYLGSGQWLLQDEAEFGPWKRSERDILFLQGIVGSGKTSLTSMVIQHLLETEPVAFFYCSANASPLDPSRTVHNETINIFQSILAQCSLQPDGTIVDQIRSAFDNSDRQSSGGCDMTLGGVLSTLESILQERGDKQITFVFDALDECKDQGEFLRCLADLMKAVPKLRVFVSTRFGVDVEEFFDSYRSLSVGEHNSIDIGSYVENEIDKRGAKLSPIQAARLKGALNKHADGVFRWVVLEIDIFLPRTQRQGGRMLSKDVDRRLTKLENSQAPPVERLLDAYEELYKYALGDEEEESRRSVVKAAMKWVLCSFTQLRADALCYAVSIQPDGTEDEDITVDDILAYCSNFLVRVSGDVIKLAHLSVRQFFEERKSVEFSPPQQHLQIAIACLQRVHSRADGEGAVGSVFDLLDLLVPQAHKKLGGGIGDGLASFNHYTYSYWSMHCRASSKCDELTKLLESPDTRDVFRSELTPLHMEIATGTDLAKPDILGNTLLHKSVLDNNDPGIDLLLQVDTLLDHLGLVNIRNGAGHSALHLAVMMGHDDVFRNLIAVGASTEIEDFYGLTPLQMAIMFGQKRIIELVAQLRLPGSGLFAYAWFFNQMWALQTLVKSAESLDESENKYAWSAYDGPLAKKSVTGWDFKEFFDWASKIRQLLGKLDRPQIALKDKEASSCEYCDLESWLNATQDCVYFSSRDQLARVIALKEDGKLNCKICTFLLDIIADADSETPYDEADSVRVWVRYDNISGLEATGKDVLEINFADTHTQVEICLDVKAATSALDLFKGRSINSTIQEDDVVNQITQWSDDCQHKHVLCATESKHYPTYLVQINSETEVRLIRKEELSMHTDTRYVFLSAMWGTQRNFLQTNRSNLNELMESIPFQRLGLLHQDAIRISWKLGYRFLWVDVLCIEQDSPNRDYTSVNFASCISGADLVLAASTTMTESILPERNKDSTVTFQASLCQEESNQVSFNLQLRRPLTNATTAMNDNVISRAWRLQEAVLPRRLVLFDEQQLIWSCCETSRSEGSAADLQPWFEPFQTLKRRLYNSERSPSSIHLDAFTYWCSVAEMASKGNMTYERDRLDVVESIVGSIRPFLSPTCEYHSGIWTDDIWAGLLWTTSQPYRTSDNNFSFEGHPSFSWAANRAPISYSLSIGLRVERDADIEEILHYIGSGDSSATLIVSAVTKEVDEDCSDVQHYTFFWDAVSAPSDEDAEQSNEDIESSDEVGELSYANAMTSGMEGSTLALVAPWTCRPTPDIDLTRWAGLILQKRDEGVYIRKGVFLGHLYKEKFAGWQRQEFELH